MATTAQRVISREEAGARSIPPTVRYFYYNSSDFLVIPVGNCAQPQLGMGLLDAQKSARIKTTTR